MIKRKIEVTQGPHVGIGQIVQRAYSHLCVGQRVGKIHGCRSIKTLLDVSVASEPARARALAISVLEDSGWKMFADIEITSWKYESSTGQVAASWVCETGNSVVRYTILRGNIPCCLQRPVAPALWCQSKAG